MDILHSRCTSCGQTMQVARMVCRPCSVTMEGEFAVPALARLSLEDQLFVVAFVRHHGSIKKMESLFGISYPTVKNRLNAIGAALDRSFEVPSSNLLVLEKLAAGDLTVDQALEEID